MGDRIRATATQNLRGISAGQEVLVDPEDEYTRRALNRGSLISDEWTLESENASEDPGSSDVLVMDDSASENAQAARSPDGTAGDGSEAQDAVAPAGSPESG